MTLPLLTVITPADTTQYRVLPSFPRMSPTRSRVQLACGWYGRLTLRNFVQCALLSTSDAVPGVPIMPAPVATTRGE